MKKATTALKAVAAMSMLLLLFTSAGTVGPRDRGSSVRAFLDVYRVLQHPRCLNCHPSGDRPLHGDDSHPHSFEVKRGEDGRGLPGARCTKCHQSFNQPGEHKPPGAPYPAGAKMPPGAVRWHLPSAKMPLTFQGRTPGQLCRQLLNPKLNGGIEDPAKLAGHVANDPFVQWGWEPGGNRTTPPGTHAQFVETVRRWIEEGPACPSE